MKTKEQEFVTAVDLEVVFQFGICSFLYCTAEFHPVHI